MLVRVEDRDTKIRRLTETQGLAAVRTIARDEAKGDRQRFEEYVSLGSAILTHVAPGYDEEAGNFSTFVNSYVRWGILDHKRGETRNRRALRAIGIALRHFGAIAEEPFNAVSDPHEHTQNQLERYVRQAVGESVLAVEALGPDEQANVGQRKATVEAILETIGEAVPQAPLVWRVFFVEQMTTEDAAAALGVSRATATRRKKALRDLLLERLADHDDNSSG